MPRVPPMWTAPPQWQGEVAFIICGGPSVLSHNLELLRGRKVVVVNSSCETIPWADVLFFNDSRWWRTNKDKVERFAGLVVSTAPTAYSSNIQKMRKANPPGLTEDRSSLSVQHTSTTGAVNLLAHFGVVRIGVLGLDGKASKDGKTHHHAPHPWPRREQCWTTQRKDLETIRKPLIKRGIELILCGSGSAYADLWPEMSLEEFLCQSDSLSSAMKRPIEKNSSAMDCAQPAMI